MREALFVASLLGFFISVIYVMHYSVSFAVAFAIVFVILFIASARSL